MADLFHNGIGLLSETNVSLAADASTTLYTVPVGKVLILILAALKVGADPNATDISIGASAGGVDFVPATDLNLILAANDVAILMPIPAINVLCGKAYAAGAVIIAKVTNQAGGATNALYLFGFLDNA